MRFEPVIYLSDALFFMLLALLAWFAWWQHHKQSGFMVVLWKRPLAAVCMMVMAVYFSVALLDSLHFRSSSSYQVHSVLDVLLKGMEQGQEQSYSAPFASHAFVPSTRMNKDGVLERYFAPLHYADHRASSPHEHRINLMKRSVRGVLYGVAFYMLFVLVFLSAFFSAARFRMRSFGLLLKKQCAPYAWKSMALVFLMLLVLIAMVYQWSWHYHIMGTDKVGNDVFYESLKSIRTGVLIGSLTTLFMLPFALFLGTLAGYCGGWVDDVIQYLYTTISSIPGVLLISASVLALQLFMARHASWFPSIEGRADMRLVALCLILGLSSWTGLCRLLRGETLKWREQDFVLVAKSLGVRTPSMLVRHIIPNVMALVLMTMVLDFSGLVLAEAVLSYVGVGVDPTTLSWGNMINSARLEMARQPVVWWPLLSAFLFMFIFVLSANGLADALRDVLDPHLNASREVPS